MIDGPLLLDTHVLWWWENGIKGEISPSTMRQIEAAERERRLHISAISLWEIGMLDHKGRLVALPDALTWAHRALAVAGRTLVPLTPDIAIMSTRLPEAPVADPIDRILLATARVENLTLVTADRKLLDYGRRRHVKVLPV
jgi:PIN domain nuclease of toxin-antitoxin system